MAAAAYHRMMIVTAAAAAVVALMMMGVGEAAAAAGPGGSCDVKQLSPCLKAFTSKTDPSPFCCKRLKEQKPCFCQYLRDPSLKKYFASPNAKNVAQVCKLSFPKC